MGDREDNNRVPPQFVDYTVLKPRQQPSSDVAADRCPPFRSGDYFLVSMVQVIRELHAQARPFRLVTGDRVVDLRASSGNDLKDHRAYFSRSMRMCSNASMGSASPRSYAATRRSIS